MAKLNASGSALLFSTYLGYCHGYLAGKSAATGNPVIADHAGELYAAGTVYDPMTIWGWPNVATVIAKIDLAGRPAISSHGAVNAAVSAPDPSRRAR